MHKKLAAILVSLFAFAAAAHAPSTTIIWWAKGYRARKQ